MELSSEQGEEAEAEADGGEEAETERDPSLVFSLKLFFSCDEVYPESGFCLGGEKLGLWGFAEERLEEKVRALAMVLGLGLGLVGGKDLRLRKRVSRWEGRRESSVKAEQLMAETWSRTTASWACEIISSTAESLSERS